MFGDEASFWLDGSLHRTWARVGQQPHVDTFGLRKTAHVFGAMSVEARPRFAHLFAPVFSGATFLIFLKQLVRRSKRKIFLIVDNGPCHNLAADGKTWLAAHRHRIELFRLPPYSPNLNPIEGAWKVTKKRTTHNRFRGLHATAELARRPGRPLHVVPRTPPTPHRATRPNGPRTPCGPETRLPSPPSPLPEGEGREARPHAQQDPLWVGQYLTVGNPERGQPSTLQDRISDPVTSRPWEVPGSVDLDPEACLLGEEVHDERANRLLPSELWPKLSTAQQAPQSPFCGSRRLAQLAGAKGRGAEQWRHRIVIGPPGPALRPRASEITPPPSPSGRGVGVREEVPVVLLVNDDRTPPTASRE